MAEEAGVAAAVEAAMLEAGAERAAEVGGGVQVGNAWGRRGGEWWRGGDGSSGGARCGCVRCGCARCGCADTRCMAVGTHEEWRDGWHGWDAGCGCHGEGHEGGARGEAETAKGEAATTTVADTVPNGSPDINSFSCRLAVAWAHDDVAT